MIRRLLTAAAMLALALLLGLGATWLTVIRSDPGTPIGAWRLLAGAGSTEAGLYTKARVALFGLFALERSEAIYFTALQDTAGHRLRARCAYEISGIAPAARWWSITAYGADQFLIANPSERYSYNMGNLDIAADGRFSLVAGGPARPGTWLPAGDGDGAFNLMLRVYQPGAAIAADPARMPMPAIRPLGACA